MDFYKFNEDFEIYFNDKLRVVKSLTYLYFFNIFPIVTVILIIIVDACSTRPFVHSFFYFPTLCILFYITITQILLVNFLLLFKRRYSCLNLYLENLIKQRTNETHTISEIKELRRIYRKINKSLLKLCKIFGYFTFIYNIYFVTRIVYWIFLATHPERIINYFYIVVFAYIAHSWV